MTEASVGTAATPSIESYPEPSPEQRVVRELASLFIDVLNPFGVAMARHIHEQEPSLKNLSDDEAVDATRASCVGNMREIFSMLRAGLPAETQQTPPQALEYARYLRRRGAGYETVTGGYQYGVAMFRDVLGLELPHRISDPGQMQRIGAAADEFLFTYIGSTLDRLTHEYDDAISRPWHPTAADAILANPASLEAAKRFRDEQISRGRWLADSAEHSGARAESMRILDEFAAIIEDAASDPELSGRLSLAETTVECVLADDPDLSVTLLFDRDPVEVRRNHDSSAEITLRIASFDLQHLASEDFRLPMAIARGRVTASGPVRKFLRVVPVLGPIGTRYSAKHSGVAGDESAAHTGNGHYVEYVETDPDDPDQTGLSSAQRDALEKAAEYRYHSGALAVTESHPGDFWSVECIDVYKAFGRNRVLNGLNLGIPEGMITVILGPSGTGKSVLINHLIGLMFPDHGDILVHGKSVSNRRRSELFEMRREFGILFQDGALFGSLSVYDNVAFPLREQTNKSEEQIRRIVEQRLEEVGLTDAARRMPSEISGGMKKRAGFARALVMEPKIVMFDEPDSGLDPVRTALLCDLIRKVHGEHGGTYIVITHDIASARRLGDYIAVLWKGRIVESGDAERMFNSENPFVRQFLSGASVGPLGME
ncbi:MAG: ATP-binding cassette domain-containing protein [Solirubrobacteraceae bacterium]